MIHLITGCMGSGKSAKLIELYDRYSSNGDRIFVASCTDNDQESDYITSRNSYKVFTNTAINNKFIAMVKASSETVKSNLAKSYDVFILDECQWLDLEVFTRIFKPLSELHNKKVIIAGLNLDYKGLPFPVTSHIFAYADRVEVLETTCHQHYSKPAKYSLYLGGDFKDKDNYCAASPEYFYQIYNKTNGLSV